MIQIKKTILTLVALLAVTTGAWADETLLLTIESTDNTSFKSGSKTFDDKVTVTFSSSVRNDGDGDGWFGSSVFSSLLTVTGTNGYTITSCKFYTAGGTAATGYTVEGESPSVYLSDWLVYTDANKSVNIGEPGVKKIEVYTAAPSSGPEVSGPTIVEGKPQWTFTMPGGNVTLEPEYYPQAALAAAPTAINDVPATTDGAIVNAGTVANIGETTTAQGTVMYYVSPTALDDAALQALAADQWTADVPTAADLAQGQAYVYYYVRGNDGDTDDEIFSDGDILAANALSVTIAAEPTYDVTYAEGTQDADKWTVKAGTDGSFQSLPLKGVKAGTKVKLKYDGDRSMLKGVKAEKKGASTPLDNTTTAWTAGTYAVPAGGLTYSDAITVSGDVTLTLTDGETLTLNKGISLAEGATLTVEGNGTMNINGTNNSTASTVAGTGMLVLTSGTLNAKGGDGENGHSGWTSGGGNAINGAVTVSGGTLTATGGNGGSDNDGSGWRGAGAAAISGDVIITAGIVTAKGGNGGSLSGESDAYAGAGGNAINGNVTLSGGTLTKTDGNSGTKGGDADGYVGAGGKAVAGTVTDNR